MKYHGSMSTEDMNDSTEQSPLVHDADKVEMLADPDIDSLVPAESTDDSNKDPVLLVVHASVGSGHRSAAMAIAEAFEGLEAESMPKNLKVEVLDILDYGRIVFDGDKTASMFTGATRPFYDITWRFTLTGRLLWGGGTIWSHMMYGKFSSYIEKTKPIAVICTHITAANAAVSAKMLTGQNYPILCVPTDYEIEGLWPHKDTDLFCVANEFMAETLRPRKVPEEEIKITGIPTRKSFREHYDKQEVRKSMGLPSDKAIILVLAGAHLPRPYIHLREAMDKTLPYLHTYPNMHFVFIAGEDKQYADHLRQSTKELGITNVTVFDYVENMGSLMASSDAAICKSGGLTVTECLCSQVPMILMGRAYGQEKSNVRMLTSVGAAMHVITPRELLEALRHLNNNPKSMQAMLISGLMIRRPNAALDIAHASLELAEKAATGKLQKRKKHFLHFYWGRKPAHDR